MTITRCRHLKKGPFYFQITDFSCQAAFVEHGNIRRSVLSRHPGRIELDGPLHASKACITCVALIPTGNPSEIHEMTENFWKKYWESTQPIDLDHIRALLENIQPVPPFDPSISLEEVQEGLRRLSARKARGPDQVKLGIEPSTV